MSDIFLSYASEDRERVRPLVEALSKGGLSVFWDRIIPLGKTWPEVLEEKLEVTRSLVVVWSKNSIKSKWVREEANEGIYLELPLFPVLLDGVRPPLGFRSMQAADLSAWDGSATSPIILNFIREIQNSLGKSGTSETAEPTTPEPELVQPRRPKPRHPAPSKKNDTPPEKEFTNSLGMKLVLIPAGTFMMGSPADEEDRFDNEVQHQVTISRPLYLQTTPVTQGQWQQVMGDNPSYCKDCGEDCPVEQVSWDDIQEFLKKLNQMEKTEKYRLPSEGEWEYACRAGSKGGWCFGDDESQLGKYAWYDENSEDKTNPVGQKKPNAWGLYDMHGNVYEWCQDWYGEYPTGPVTDPTGAASGARRVLRGGSWPDYAWFTRSAFRSSNHPGYRFFTIGFRVARAL